MELPARVVHAGFAVKLEVEIEGMVVTFVPDEDRTGGRGWGLRT